MRCRFSGRIPPSGRHTRLPATASGPWDAGIERPSGALVGAAQFVLDRGDRAVLIQRRRVGPAFAERVRDVTDDRPLQLELEVVPGRSIAVPIAEHDGLRVTVVTRIVVATVAEIDATDERHVVIRTHRTLYQDKLLMMAAASPHALIEQDFTACVVDHADELGVLLLAEVSLARM